jgi:hypothetical protein
MSVAKAVRLGRRRSSRRSPAGATAAATARAHIRYKDAFTSTHDFTKIQYKKDRGFGVNAPVHAQIRTRKEESGTTTRFIMVNLDNPDWLTRQLMKLDPAILYAVMRTFKVSLAALDWTLDAATGFSLISGSTAERSSATKVYERSAQVVDILGRGTLSIIYNFGLKNFVYKHVK